MQYLGEHSGWSATLATIKKTFSCKVSQRSGKKSIIITHKRADIETYATLYYDFL